MKCVTFSFLAIGFVALISAGCVPSKAKVADPTELHAYVESAQQQKASTAGAEGSLWVDNAYQSNLFRDPKARYINDILTIKVSEATTAVASADTQNGRGTSLTAGFDNLFGAEKLIKEIPTMVSGKSNSGFQGKGSASRASTLDTNLTARVIDVMPNGYLVVQGMREIHFNNENQSVFLTGVVRPEDIGPSNIVLSSSIAQMTVRIQGKGIVSQPTKPGWLYKILTGILPF
jgi:flagellar L-ring protein FlgH